MIVEIFVAFFALFFFGYLYLYLFPKRKIQQFAQQAQKLGYKVKLIPFQFMQYYMVNFEQQQSGNLRVFKEQMAQYDLVVGHMFRNLAVMPVSSLLLKDFYNQLNKLPKNPFISEVFLKFLNGGGILMSQGDVWRRKRRIISSVFHYDFLNDMIPAIEQQIDHYFKEIDQAIEKSSTINIQILMVKILSSVIARCFFGTEMRQHLIQGRQYSDYFIEYLEQVNSFTISSQHAFLGMLGPRFGLTEKCRNLVRKFKILYAATRQITLKQLQKIKSNQIVNKNLLTTLYEGGLLSLNQNSNPEQYSLEQLIGQFFTFVGAGTDTSSHTINLMLHYLNQHPQYTQKLREQTKLAKQCKNLSPGQNLKKLVWADAIFNETLRINGPAAQIIPRISNEEVTLGSLRISKGTSFNVLPLINHYREEYFDRPYQFRPQRWIGDIKLEPYSFMPFAGGQRNCIGQYLAKIQAKLLLSKIVQKYEFKSIYPIRMKKLFFFVTQHGDFQMAHRKKNQ